MSFVSKIAEAYLRRKGLISGESVDRVSGMNMFSVQVPDLSAIWGQYTDSNLTVLFHEVPEIYTPVHIIASLISSGVFTVKKMKDDSPVDNNKYMNRLLSSPNPLQNWQELIYQAMAYQMVTGKNYLYANVPDTLTINYRNISTLINLPADNVQLRTDPMIKILSATAIEDLILDYLTPDGAQGIINIPPSKVMYTKYTSLYAYDLNIRGRSPLLSAQKAITNLIAVYEARNVIYTKRGALGFLVSKKGDASGMIPLSPKEKKELQDDYNKTYGLTSSKSPVAITSLPVDYIQVAATIADLQPFEETEYDASAIFAVYGVPRELMPRKEGATFENYNHALKSLYENAVIPRAKSLVRSISAFLKLEEVDLYLDVDFGHVKVLQENLKEKSAVDWRNNETSRVRFQYGIITLNDWRTTCGLEPAQNGLYNKLIYDMTPDELTKVETILKLSSGSTTGDGLGNAEPKMQDNASGN
jgi:HK97 family phage portal protein